MRPVFEHRMLNLNSGEAARVESSSIWHIGILHLSLTCFTTNNYQVQPKQPVELDF